MKMKKLMAILAALSLMPVSAFAVSTVTVEPVDLKDSRVKISGTLDSKKADEVMIIVTKPGTKLENINGNYSGSGIVYQQEKKADANGNYSFNFTINDNLATTGEYTVYVKADSMKTTTFRYADENGKNSVVTGVNGLSEAEIEAKLKATTDTPDTYRNLLSLDSFKAYDGADKAQIAKDLVAKRPFADTQEKAAYVQIQEAIKESAILSCYNAPENQNKKGYIVDSNKDFENAGLIGLTNLEPTTENMTTQANFYSVYKTILSDAGKDKVIADLQGNDPAFTSYSDIKNKFMESVLLNSITNAKDAGSAHISTILTSANVAAINNPDLTAAITGTDGYLANSNLQNNINGLLLGNGSYASLKDLADKIVEAIATAKSNQDTPSPSPSPSPSNPSGVVGPGASVAGDNSGNNVSATTGFKDLPNSHWAYEPVMELYKTGVVNGFPEGTYKPNGKITREQAVKMLCEALYVSEAQGVLSFSDVAEGAWYEKYIRNAVNNGFVNGINETRFGVGTNITRQDLAVMIYRILGEPTVEGGLNFSDAGKIAGYARNAMTYMTTYGIMNGYPDGTIRPTAQISRAEAAKMIYNCIKGGF